MKNLTRFIVVDVMAFFDALAAHAVVPIIPVWVIYIYSIPIEFITVYGIEKVLGVIKRWVW